MRYLGNGRAAWQCPDCATFNDAAVASCQVCSYEMRAGMTATKTKTAKTSTRKTKAKETLKGWPPELWQACFDVQKALDRVGVPIALDDIREWGEDGRADVQEWLASIERGPGHHARLPEVLSGLLPAGWKRPEGADAKPQAKSKSKPQPKTPKDETVDLELAAINPSPDNPRKRFEGLEELAKSLQKDGQLQEIVVYPTGNGIYEIVGGERRYRAAKIAKWKTIRARVLNITPEEAIEKRGIENYERKQFTPFEEARWMEQMKDAAGYTQKALANKLECTQGKIGNTLGLLKLPEEWEDIAVDQQISPTCLRHLVPWAHRHNVLDGVAMAAREFDQPPTVDDFRRTIAAVVKQQSRPMDADWSGPLFKVTDELREELDIEEVENRWGSKESRAFNVKLWEKHQRDAKKKERDKQKAREQKAGKPDSKEPETPNSGELKQLWAQWWRHTLADRLEGKLTKAKQAVVLQLGFAIAVENPDFIESLGDYWPDLPLASYEENAKDIAKFPFDKFQTEIHAACVSVLRDDKAWKTFWREETRGLETCRAFSEIFDIDPARDWSPEYEWLELLSIEQLRRLPAAQLVDPEFLHSLAKADLIERLIENWPDGRGVPEVLQLKTEN